MKHLAIEPLESRIAPAAVFTYTDFDGDLVTVKSSKGTLDDLAAAATINNGVLLRLDLSDPKFQGAAISITAQPKPGEIGDGLASVGFIDATNVDLVSVTVDGDLGRIIAGDTIRTTPGIKSLKVGSLGALDVTTQQAGGNLVSKVEGSVGSILVAGDWIDASFTVLGDPAVAKDGQVGRVSIGGTMKANSATPGAAQLSVEDGIGSFTLRGDLQGGAIESGAVLVGGEIGKLFIGGTIVGGSGENSGRISAASIKQITVNGDLRGGMGTSSATIAAGKLGSLTVGGSLIGDGFFSASIGVSSDTGSIRIGGDLLGSKNLGSSRINLGGKLGSISVGGSVRGGAGSSTGCINAVGDIGSVSIDGDLIGGAAQSTGDVTSKGSIQRVSIGGNVVGGGTSFTGRIVAGAESLPGGALGKVIVGGSLLGGGGVDSGTIFASDRIGSVTIGDDVIAGTSYSSATIRAGFDIGSLSIGGDVDAVLGQAPFAPQVLFVAGGSKTPTAGKDVAFGKVTIGGSMFRGAFLAGYSANGITPSNPDAQIGTITIKGDFVASSIVAGVKNDDGLPTLVYFGDANDQSIGGGNPATIASIAKIVIGGTVRGTNAGINNTDFYAIAAEQVKSLVIGGTSIPLNAGAHNDPTGGIGNGFLGYTGDVRVREI